MPTTCQRVLESVQKNVQRNEHDMSTQSQTDKCQEGNVCGPLRLYNEMT